jgi:hypothetical protein
MLKNCVNFLASLRLTVVCLGLAIIVVFVGTLAEVRIGLYAAQAEIFRSFFVHWTPSGTHLRIPVFPGGWLVGLVLLANLLAAHIRRFQLSKKKAGIWLIHAGLIFLLAGQFLTEVFQVESQMRLPVGATMNYTEDSRNHELAVIDVTDPARDSTVAIPEPILARGGEIRAAGLPFTLRVTSYFTNSTPDGPIPAGGENRPAARVEVVAGGQSSGELTVSYWQAEPQKFKVAGRAYQMALRPVRHYKPYSITLLEFKHDTYPGTDIPSNFSSKIRLRDPARGEDRDVLIRMNTPLRYAGETFYQASFEEGDKVSILQVVRNPAAITPYVACTLVALGLTVQFLMHLIGFVRKRAQQAPAAGTPQITLQPAPAGKRSSP